MENILNDTVLFTMAIVLIGLVALVSIWWFGTKLAQSPVIQGEQLKRLIEFLEKSNSTKNPFWNLTNMNADHLQRRNEYWTTYVQTVAAVFIVIVIAVLLLAKVIEPDAGLPILSAISGFVIAKAVTGGRTGNGQDSDGKT